MVPSLNLTPISSLLINNKLRSPRYSSQKSSKKKTSFVSTGVIAKKTDLKGNESDLENTNKTYRLSLKQEDKGSDSSEFNQVVIKDVTGKDAENQLRMMLKQQQMKSNTLAVNSPERERLSEYSPPGTMHGQRRRLRRQYIRPQLFNHVLPQQRTITP